MDAPQFGCSASPSISIPCLELPTARSQSMKGMSERCTCCGMESLVDSVKRDRCHHLPGESQAKRRHSNSARVMYKIIRRNVNESAGPSDFSQML